jgi:outer membrane protein OmpA-like peptidoglycan-associated protein
LDAVGEKDIYVSFKNDDGTWSSPKNLGPDINTAENETSPFLAPDGETVYFSTKGYPGYGGMDMFVSRRLDESWTKWSRPQNLGPKLNTNGFDAYYSIPASGDYAYFSSAKNSLGLNDILRVKIPESAKPKPVVLIKGKVMNAKTKQPLDAGIVFGSLLDSLNKGFAKSNPNSGEYSIVLTAGAVYSYLAQKEGFLSLSESIDLKIIESYMEITVDLQLMPIESGAVIRLNNLFFDTNKFNIKKEAEKELNRVYELMIKYPKMQIEISGHTDNVGSDQENLTLSINRAKSVADYLYLKGIQKDRIKYTGKGKTLPLADNNSEKGKAINRRIEMKVLKIE